MNKREKTVDSVFRIAKKGELLFFLKKLALTDENVAKKMESRFLKSVKWDYTSDIATAFDEFQYDEDYESQKATGQIMIRVASRS